MMLLLMMMIVATSANCVDNDVWNKDWREKKERERKEELL